MNAGVDAQSSVGHINNFKLWFPLVPGLKAKYVLVYLCSDEVFKPELEQDYSNKMDEMKADSVSFAHYVAMNSATYFIARGLVGTWINYFRFGVGRTKVDFDSVTWIEYPLQKNHERIFQPMLLAYQKRLKVLSQKIKTFGAIPIFVNSREGYYQFFEGRWKASDKIHEVNHVQYNGMDRFLLARETTKITRQVSIDEGILFINLLESTDFTARDFHDFYHNNPSGALKVGRGIAEGITPVILQNRR